MSYNNGGGSVPRQTGGNGNGSDPTSHWDARFSADSALFGITDAADVDLTAAELRELGLSPPANSINNNNGNNGNSGPSGSNAGEEDSDVRLWAQNQRFQAAVMKAMEHSVGILQDKLRENLSTLATSEKSREDLGMALHTMRTELSRASAGLARTRQDLSDAVSARKLALAEAAAVGAELVAARRRGADLEAELLRARAEAVTARDAQLRGKQLYGVLEAEYKVAANQISGLRSEVEAKAAELRNLKTKDGDKSTELATVTNQLAAAKEQLTVAAAAAARAAAEARGQDAELAAVTAKHTTALKQLSDAAAAMQQRDTALRVLAERHAAVSDQLRTEQARAKRAERDADNTADAKADLARAAAADSAKLASAAAGLAAAAAAGDKLSGDLELARKHVNVLTEEAAGLRRAEAVLTDQVETQRARASAAAAECDSLKQQLAEARAEAARVDAAAKASDGKLRAQLEKGLSSAQQAVASSENGRLRTDARLSELEQELRRAVSAKESAESELASLRGRYEEVYGQAKSREDALERATHRANRYQGETVGVEARAVAELEQYKTAADAEITALKSQLRDKSKQYDALSMAFVDAQQKVLQTTQREQSGAESVSSAKSQLALATAMRDRHQREALRAAQETVVSVKEGQEAKLLQRRAEGTVAELQETVAVLQGKLNDAMFYERAKKAAYDSEITELRGEIARLRADGHGVTGLVIASQRERAAAEAQARVQQMKLKVAEDKLERAREEMGQLRQQVRAQGAAGSLVSKQYNLWSKQFEVVVGKELARRQKEIANIVSQQHLHSSTSNANSSSGASGNVNSAGAGPGSAGANGASGGGGSSSTDSAFMSELISTLRDELHQSSTLNATRLQEILALRQRLNAVALSDQELGDRESAYVGKVQELILSKKNLSSLCQSLRGKVVRAETIAAALENELIKEVNPPAGSIDYSRLLSSANSSSVRDAEISAAAGAGNINTNASDVIAASAALKELIHGPGFENQSQVAAGPIKPHSNNYSGNSNYPNASSSLGGGITNNNNNNASLPSLLPLQAPTSSRNNATNSSANYYNNNSSSSSSASLLSNSSTSGLFALSLQQQQQSQFPLDLASVSPSLPHNQGYGHGPNQQYNSGFVVNSGATASALASQSAASLAAPAATSVATSGGAQMPNSTSMSNLHGTAAANNSSGNLLLPSSSAVSLAQAMRVVSTGLGNNNNNSNSSISSSNSSANVATPNAKGLLSNKSAASLQRPRASNPPGGAYAGHVGAFNAVTLAPGASYSYAQPPLAQSQTQLLGSGSNGALAAALAAANSNIGVNASANASASGSLGSGRGKQSSVLAGAAAATLTPTPRRTKPQTTTNAMGAMNYSGAGAAAGAGVGVGYGAGASLGASAVGGREGGPSAAMLRAMATAAGATVSNDHSTANKY